MKYKSEMYKVMHQDAQADFEVGAISADRMREYDKACFVPERETARKPKNPKKAGRPNPAAAGV